MLVSYRKICQNDRSWIKLLAGKWYFVSIRKKLDDTDKREAMKNNIRTSKGSTAYNKTQMSSQISTVTTWKQDCTCNTISIQERVRKAGDTRADKAKAFRRT